jgi:hypothetical protein
MVLFAGCVAPCFLQTAILGVFMDCSLLLPTPNYAPTWPRSPLPNRAWCLIKANPGGAQVLAGIAFWVISSGVILFFSQVSIGQKAFFLGNVGACHEFVVSVPIP